MTPGTWDAGRAARAAWEVFETVHDVVYFTPEARAAADALGMRGFWMGYVVLRAAPLGPLGPAPVAAMFHGFHPDRIHRALPDAWTLTTPADALDARLRASVDALRRLGGAALDDARVAEAADLAWRAASAVDVPGRPLAAANLALPRPADPVAALWQACTTLREHRGDGHVAVLVARGVGPVEAHVLKAAAGEADATMLRESRRFSQADWDVAVDALVRWGWLDGPDALAPRGVEEHREIERLTDRAAATPWLAVGPDVTRHLVDLLTPLADAVSAAGVIPHGNPTGLSREPGRAG